MRLAGPFAALQLPGFRWYSLGNGSSLIGSWAQRTVLFWLAWEMTESTSVLGLMAMLDLMPAVIMAPIGGSLADRFDRLRVSRLVQYLSILPPLALLIALLLDALTLPVLLCGVIASGLASGLDHPIPLVLVGSITPRKMIPQAVGLNSLTFNLSRMLGPIIGGWCIAYDQYAAIFLLNIFSYIVFADVLRRIQPASRDHEGATTACQGPIGWRGVLPGMGRFEKLSLAYYGAIAFCLRPIMELLPAFAATLATAGPAAVTAFTMMSSAVGAGAMLGALVASNRQGREMIIYSGFVSAAALLVFGLSTNIWLSCFAVALGSGGSWPMPSRPRSPSSWAWPSSCAARLLHFMRWCCGCCPRLAR